MKENAPELVRPSAFSEIDESNSFSQYLSFRFFKENIDHLKDRTKDSMNNFLKTISEIEDEFMIMLHGQQIKNLEFNDSGLNLDNAVYMEENY